MKNIINNIINLIATIYAFVISLFEKETNENAIPKYTKEDLGKCSKGLKFIVNENGFATVIDYTGNEEIVYIPETVNGYIINAIDPHVFANKNVKTIVMFDPVDYDSQKALKKMGIEIEENLSLITWRINQQAKETNENRKSCASYTATKTTLKKHYTLLCNHKVSKFEIFDAMREARIEDARDAKVKLYHDIEKLFYDTCKEGMAVTTVVINGKTYRYTADKLYVQSSTAKMAAHQFVNNCVCIA